MLSGDYLCLASSAVGLRTLQGSHMATAPAPNCRGGPAQLPQTVNSHMPRAHHPSAQLPPSLASLAPAAGPDPAAPIIPRGTWGLYQHPRNNTALLTACIWGPWEEGWGERLGLSREAKRLGVLRVASGAEGVWDAERDLGCYG